MGTYIDVKKDLPDFDGKPVLLHFFNPSCPCSRFNITYFKKLEKKFNDKVKFAVVLEDKDTSLSIPELKNKFGLNIPVIRNHSLTVNCGVYSTPQAVILTPAHSLFFRGNYNKSRYCANKNSNYAEMALDSLLSGKISATFNKPALVAYGCQVAYCNNK